jgi:hypothetical protein
LHTLSLLLCSGAPPAELDQLHCRQQVTNIPLLLSSMYCNKKKEPKTLFAAACQIGTRLHTLASSTAARSSSKQHVLQQQAVRNLVTSNFLAAAG